MPTNVPEMVWGVEAHFKKIIFTVYVKGQSYTYTAPVFSEGFKVISDIQFRKTPPPHTRELFHNFWEDSVRKNILWCLVVHHSTSERYGKQHSRLRAPSNSFHIDWLCDLRSFPTSSYTQHPHLQSSSCLPHDTVLELRPQNKHSTSAWSGRASLSCLPPPKYSVTAVGAVVSLLSTNCVPGTIFVSS